MQRGAFQDDLQHVRPRLRRSARLRGRAGLQHILQVEALLRVILCTGALMQFLHSTHFNVQAGKGLLWISQPMRAMGAKWLEYLWSGKLRWSTQSLPTSVTPGAC